MDVVRALSSVLPGATVSESLPERLTYSRDLWPRRLIEVRAGHPAPHPPLAVVWPRDAGEVAALVRFARQERIALVPFGAGSGVCGGVVPGPRTVVVDLKAIADRRIDAEASVLDVGAGAMGITLEEDLERAGATVGHFPSSILCSTTGGWVAARGAGQCSGLYGKIEDMVVSLECVLGTGDIVTLHRRFDGPNLVPLMIGSEGTLGVITRCRFRLHPAPRSRTFAAFEFPDIRAGWDAMRLLFQSGLRPAVSRLYDPIDSAIMRQGSVRSHQAGGEAAAPSPRRIRSRPSAKAIALRTALRMPRALNALIEAAEGSLLAGCTLVLVFEGQAEQAEADRERATELCRHAHGAPLGEAPARKWLAHRYSVSYRQAPVFRLGAFSDTMEVAAPWSKLEALYDGVRRALGRHVLVMAHLSHAYPDGCSIYFTFSAATRNDDAALALYDAAWRDALAAAIDAGGTLSHHHGVGRSKAPRLGRELGFGVELVRRLMRAWDPSGILNPGNLVPRDDAPAQPIAVGSPFRPGEIDEASLLATFAGTETLAGAEAALSARGLELDLDIGVDRTRTVDDWVARGMPGSRSPWSDPVAQPLAGLTAVLRSGEELQVRPAPRRAVGPDLTALFAGAGGSVGRVSSATLGVHRSGVPRARALPFALPQNPALTDDERAAWTAAVGALVPSDEPRRG